MRRGKFERAKSLMERLRPMTRSIIAIVLCMALPVSVLAAVTADVSLGDVSIGDTQVTHTVTAGEAPVTQDHGGSVTVTGSSDTNTVTVTAGSTEAPANVHVEIQTTEGGNTNVVLDNANIETPRGAMEVTGGGDVVIELDGTNSLVTTNNYKAGLQVAPDSSITIQDANNDGGSLTAQGATWGAGIGGNANDIHGDVTITGGTIVATGGQEAAGIGGGQGTVNGNITITGGNVTAQGASGAAGIGSGSYGSYGGNCGDITISGGTVTANGGTGAAGIGGGRIGLTGDIIISGGNITATGGASYNAGGAGIGSGMSGNMVDMTINGTDIITSSNDITISGGNVTATGGGKAADIGHGTGGNQRFPDDPVTVTISGNAVISTTGTDDAVIGAGDRSAEVTVDTSKLTAQGSINGVVGTYAPPAPPAPPVVEEPAPVVPAAPAPEVIEEVKAVEPPVVKVTEEEKTVKVQGEEVKVALNESTVKVEIPEVVVTEENAKPTSLELVITVAPEAIQTESEKVDATATKTVVAALKEIVKEIKLEHVAEEQETTLAVNEYKVHLDQDGTITLELTEKLMQKLGKGIHEFVITIGGMEIVFSIEIK